MTREITKKRLRDQIAEKYSHKCYACNYSLSPVLRTHHVVPIHLGGDDNPINLVTLCSNCHALIHFYGSKRFQDKDIDLLLAGTFNSSSVTRLKLLINKIQEARQKTLVNKNIIDTAHTLSEAIRSVGEKNHYSYDRQQVLAALVQRVIKEIPKELTDKCSYRLLGAGKYISVNIMNYLLFRIPAFGDLGGQPVYDFYLIFPSSTRNEGLIDKVNERVVFEFTNFECVNVGLYFNEVASLHREHWHLFKQACRMAMIAKRSREWASNIRL